MKHKGSTSTAQVTRETTEPTPLSSNQYLISTIQAATMPPAAMALMPESFSSFLKPFSMSLPPPFPLCSAWFFLIFPARRAAHRFFWIRAMVSSVESTSQ